MVTTESYTYATTANRLETVNDGSVTRTFTYDAAGNVTDDNRGPDQDYDLTYDDRGRLTKLTKNGLTQTHYTLNGAGERVSKLQAGSTAHYHYDAGGALLAESDDLGNPTTEYIALAGLPLALVDHAGGTATVLRVHADHLGTPQSMTDDLGAVVWERHQRPFGETASETGTTSNDRRFPGQLFDAESGYHYNYFRDYDPSIGRYLQSDPIGLRGGLNTYAYAGNDPINFIDPNGLTMQGGCAANPTLPHCGPGGGEQGGGRGTFGGGSIGPGYGGVTFDDLIKWCIRLVPGVLLNEENGDSDQNGNREEIDRDQNEQIRDRPPGYWKGDRGAEEWGRRNGEDKREARRKFHDIKKSDETSQASDDYSVNPETGDVIDINGESVGNLFD